MAVVFEEAIPTKIGPYDFTSSTKAAKFFGVGPHVIGRAMETASPEAYVTRRLIAACLKNPHDEKTLTLVRDLLDYIAKPNPLGALADRIRKKHGITTLDLKSAAREQSFVKARYAFIRSAHAEGFSISEIARFLNRDRATIRAAFKPDETLKEE